MDKEKQQGSKAMSFRILARAQRARRGILTLPHSEVETPVFMPVGTQGTMKGVLPEQLIAMDCRIMLCNTYHLGHRPGHDLVHKAGGVHKMINWPRSILTDSGGFQMVSLNKLMSVDEKGVQFESPHTHQFTELTPEHCIHMQEQLGADIIMQLDHVIHVLNEGPLVEEAMQRSIRWLDRCQAAHQRKDQLLFGIVQGGLDMDLRTQCAQQMAQRANIGIAIGGLSGGEDKSNFWKVVALCCEQLPEGLARYVMGVGWPADLVMCSLLGADMFDCVYPTRTARFGSALVSHGGLMHLTRKEYAQDFAPIDGDCSCYTCQNYSRAYLHSVINQEAVGCHLISLHNIQHQLHLMRRVREAISAHAVEGFLRQFLTEQYPTGQVPMWIHEAAAYLGYNINAVSCTCMTREGHMQQVS